MPEQHWIPEKVYIDEEALTASRTQEILKRVPEAEKIKVRDVKELARKIYERPHRFTEGKQTLFLTRHRGKFLSMCPALTESAVCCNYRTINIIMGCNFDCSYCFLQAYLNNPLTTFYVNLDDMFDELKSAVDSHPEKIFRFGTGEFTDSLSLDPILGINKDLITFFAERKNASLELKTKSARVESLLDLKHNGKTIVAWSVNTEFIQKTEEHKTAAIDERIAAARKCVNAGYRVAFHFDPIIMHEDWKEGYSETARKLKESIPQDAIAWISYGSLRFVSKLKQEALTRFRTTPIFSGEFVKGFDGKMRYFTPLRTKLYQTVHRYIQEAFPKITPYICMEPEHIWEQSFDYKSPTAESLSAKLDIRSTLKIDA